ncbi:MAG: DUF2779 domain-containing protein [bacterium]
MTAKTRYLSKSQFTRALQCVKSLWLYREHPELQDPVSPELQAIFDQGTQVGILAQKWIGGGVLIDAPHTEPERALKQTEVAIHNGAQVLYEAAFLYEDVLVRVDILAKGPGGGWDLFEVKSTTKLEDYHLSDVAIQRYVLQGAGVQLGAAHLVHLDPGYVRQGPLDLRKLFLPVDVTSATEGLLDVVPEQLRRMKTVAAADEAPAQAIGPHCTKPHDCSLIGHCWKDVPDYSVFNLAGALMKKKTALWNKGIKTVAEIPDFDKKDEATKDYKLTDYQAVQRQVARSGQPHIDAKAIGELLRDLEYPRYFLDFEAVNPAVPPYDGLRPYQALPFQASVHVRREPGAPLEHREFLGDGTKDPRADLIDFLSGRLGRTGPVIAYSKSYEGGILKGLAAYLEGSGAAQGMLDLEARLFDVADPFRKAFYAHPGFKGRWSIKAVLPTLFPDTTYEGLAIQNGAAAMRAYARLMEPDVTPEERAKIMADLRAYCAQDTMAMVRILDRLEEVAAVAA